MEERFIMSQEETRRVEVLQKIEKGALKQTEARKLLDLSYRQTNRLVHKYRKGGIKALIHKNRGKESAGKISLSKQQTIVDLYRKLYPDFNLTFAREKLAEKHQLCIGRETLRQILMRNQLWNVNRSKDKTCHVWRERKHHRGEMTQMDGSHHRWLENRLDQEFCLMAYIDDATNNVFARFYEYEGIFPALESLRRFIRQNGIPAVIYLDRHSTYKTNRQAAVDEQLRDEQADTQVARVIKELGILLIHARSPQAKGRVERLFETLQDRLVKEMRLENICTLKDANHFLERYLIRFNKQFSQSPKEPASFFRTVPSDIDWQWTFAVRDTRIIATDYTIRWNNRLFLLTHPSIAYKNKSVEIKQSLDGQLRFLTKNSVLRVTEITQKTLLGAQNNRKLLERLARQSHDNHSKKSWMDFKFIGTSSPFTEPIAV